MLPAKMLTGTLYSWACHQLGVANREGRGGEGVEVGDGREWKGGEGVMGVGVEGGRTKRERGWGVGGGRGINKPHPPFTRIRTHYNGGHSLLALSPSCQTSSYNGLVFYYFILILHKLHGTSDLCTLSHATLGLGGA